jgi:phosphatidylglycerophosphate synthase
MADYEPTSRRPIATIFRRTAEAATEFSVRAGVSPYAISYLSILAAICAALCFWKSIQHPWLLIAAPLFCFLRLWFNMLDGMIAVAAGKASLRGEIVNDLPDRVSDVIIFVGVAHSGWMLHPVIGYWSAIFALLTAYVGLFGQAIGSGRQFGGLMSKPWRMVVLAIGSWITFLWPVFAQSMDYFSIFDWSCLIIIGGCVQTIIVRLKRILRSVEHQSK